MFGFIRAKTVREQVERQDSRIRKLEHLVGDLNDRLIGTEKPLKDILVEWDDYYEKFRNLYARIAKRQQREAEAEKAEPETANGAFPSDINPLALQLLQGKDES